MASGMTHHHQHKATYLKSIVVLVKEEFQTLYGQFIKLCQTHPTHFPSRFNGVEGNEFVLCLMSSKETSRRLSDNVFEWGRRAETRKRISVLYGRVTKDHGN